MIRLDLAGNKKKGHDAKVHRGGGGIKKIGRIYSPVLVSELSGLGMGVMTHLAEDPLA